MPAGGGARFAAEDQLAPIAVMAIDEEEGGAAFN